MKNRFLVIALSLAMALLFESFSSDVVVYDGDKDVIENIKKACIEGNKKKVLKYYEEAMSDAYELFIDVLNMSKTEDEYEKNKSIVSDFEDRLLGAFENCFCITEEDLLKPTEKILAKYNNKVKKASEKAQKRFEANADAKAEEPSLYDIIKNACEEGNKEEALKSYEHAIRYIYTTKYEVLQSGRSEEDLNEICAGIDVLEKVFNEVIYNCDCVSLEEVESLKKQIEEDVKGNNKN